MFVGCFCGSPGGGRSRRGSFPCCGAQPEPGPCSLLLCMHTWGSGQRSPSRFINNKAGTGRNKASPPPLTLPREAAEVAESCVSSTLHYLRDHIPFLAHSSSPGITETLLSSLPVLHRGVHTRAGGGKGAAPERHQEQGKGDVSL